MLGGADNPNGELPSYITGADTVDIPGLTGGLAIPSVLQKISLPRTHPGSGERRTRAGFVRLYPHAFSTLSTTGKKWVFRNLGGTFQARGLITRRLSNSNPARPYICRFSIFRRFTCPSTTPLLHRLVIASHIAAASASIPAATR